MSSASFTLSGFGVAAAWACVVRMSSRPAVATAAERIRLDQNERWSITPPECFAARMGRHRSDRLRAEMFHFHRNPKPRHQKKRSRKGPLQGPIRNLSVLL